MINTIGRLLRLTSFGESHGGALGGIIDGCPPGIPVNEGEIALQLKRRRAASGPFSSGRKEKDLPEFLSGVINNKTIGTPVSFIIRNSDQKPADYSFLQNIYRPSHADYSWEQKFGLPSGPGGGRSSARSLLPVVVAGTIARNITRSPKYSILAWVSSIGPIDAAVNETRVDYDSVEESPLRCPDPLATKEMYRWLDKVKNAGDTAGGVITCRIRSCPAGLGEPVFGKLHADLAHAMMTINSVKGFEIGQGFGAAKMKGSQYNDQLIVRKNKITTITNHDGGVSGGISNGADIVFRIAFKPIPSIHQKQNTVTRSKKNTTVCLSGRHDICAVPRAVPIVESLAAFIIADHFLMQKTRI